MSARRLSMQPQNTKSLPSRPQRVITNFGINDFERVFVKSSSIPVEAVCAKAKARKLLKMVAEDMSETRILFKSDTDLMEHLHSPMEEEKRGVRKATAPTVDFYSFYQEAIRGRVEQKRAEELSCVGGNRVDLGGDEASHPEFIMLEGQTGTESEDDEEDSPAPQMPRRHDAPSDFSFLVQASS